MTPPAGAMPDEIDAPVNQPPPAADALSLARGAAQRGDASEALSRYLRVLASQPDNVEALAGAGRAALDVGDVNAATGFFARAEGRDPRNGAVKAGLAAAVLQTGDARTALRFFREATDLGVQPATIAADRGLAYDLRGDTRRAQADYQLALRTRPNDEVTRRLAVSQAISGDRAGALATLDPLLRRQDVPAWRTRAFVRAMTGDVAGASEDARAILPTPQAQALEPYFVRLAQLKPAEKAAAVDLGRFPAEGKPAAQPRLAFDQAVATGPSAGDAASAARAAADAAAWAARAAPPAPVVAQAPPATDPRAEAAKRRADQRVAREQAAQTAKAKREKAAEAAAEKLARANPARHWVQVAGGANKRDLGRAWTDLRKKYPTQLAGRSPWTTHYRYTNRLLIGPFASSDAAQDWVTERRKEGFATFRVETDAGDAVEHVKG